MKLIAFSLWGGDPKYLNGATENARIARDLYPGWKCLFFVDHLCGNTQDALRELGAMVSLFPFPRIGKYYWRHCVPDVIWSGVERYIVRDCDSRINAREVAAVEAWAISGRTYHFMRDHPKHTVHWMQGMYGVAGYAMRGISRKLSFVPDERGGVNPVFEELFKRIPPDDKVEHGEYYMDRFPDQRPFPQPRKDPRFVGEIFNSDGQPNDDWKEIQVS